jgi:hypothetical protein
MTILDSLSATLKIEPFAGAQLLNLRIARYTTKIYKRGATMRSGFVLN